MTIPKIPFPSMPWTQGGHPLERKKSGGAGTVTLLELDPGFEDPAWCVRGHALYVLEGALRIDVRMENPMDLGTDVRMDVGMDVRTDSRIDSPIDSPAEIGHEVITVGAGEALRLESRSPHRAANPGPGVVRLFIVSWE